jgi:Sulfatase-modifying factor enzyme 1
MVENSVALVEPPEQSAPLNMIWVPGGTFRMGSDKHYPEEAPVHRATVSGFWIDRTPVTNRQFKQFVRATGHKTFAEIPPNPKSYPGCRPSALSLSEDTVHCMRVVIRILYDALVPQPPRSRAGDRDLCDVRVRLDSCIPVFAALAPIGLAEIIGHLYRPLLGRYGSRSTWHSWSVSERIEKLLRLPRNRKCWLVRDSILCR